MEIWRVKIRLYIVMQEVVGLGLDPCSHGLEEKRVLFPLTKAASLSQVNLKIC